MHWSLKLALDFSGGIIAYSSPVPDLLGSSNISSEQIFWEQQSHGLLTDGTFGLQDIHVDKILTYGTVTRSVLKEYYKARSTISTKPADQIPKPKA